VWLIVGILAGVLVIVSAVLLVMLASSEPDPSIGGQPPSPVPTATGTVGSPSSDGGPEPTTPGFQAAIDAELSALAEGRIAYRVPREMQAGIDSEVVVRISRGSPAGLGQGAPGPVEIERVGVAPVMAAELRGTKFDIDPRERQDQIVPPTGFAEWQWSVVPTSAGDHTLRVVVYVVLRLPDGTEEDFQIVKDRQIDVRVNAAYSLGNFLSTHLASVLGVLTALFGSGMALTFLNRRKKRAPARKKATPPAKRKTPRSPSRSRSRSP
jgi:hypothetical protein